MNAGDLRGLAVLLVEDDPGARAALRAVLRAYGAEVHCAGSVAQALRQAARRPPAVLISDLGLPDADGYALIARLRAAEADARRLTAIAISGSPSATPARAAAAGFDAFLAKPVDAADLVRRLRRLAPG